MKISRDIINQNKLTAEMKIAAQFLLSNTHEVNCMYESLDNTSKDSGYTFSDNMDLFMQITNNFISQGSAIFEEVDSRIEKITNAYLNNSIIRIKNSKQSESFQKWLSKVNLLANNDQGEFLNDDGDMDFDEICACYYWFSYIDRIDKINESDLSFNEKISDCEKPVITSNVEDNDIVTLDQIDEALTDTSPYTTGIPALDNYIKIQYGDMWFVAARPSVGKSMYVLNMALYNCLRDVDCLYVSLEMSAAQTKTRINHWKGSRNLSEEEKEKIEKRLFIFNAQEKTASQIINKMDKFAAKHEHCIIILDYIGLMRYANKTLWDSIRDASRSLKVLALKNKCVVVSCAIANRESEQMGITMSSLFGGSTQEADIDGLIGMEFDKKLSANTDKINLVVAKNRNGVKDFSLPVSIDKVTMTFSDI